MSAICIGLLVTVGNSSSRGMRSQFNYLHSTSHVNRWSQRSSPANDTLPADNSRVVLPLSKRPTGRVQQHNRRCRRRRRLRRLVVAWGKGSVTLPVWLVASMPACKPAPCIPLACSYQRLSSIGAA